MENEIKEQIIMEKAIKVLEDKVKECENMNDWFIKELQKYDHHSADQTEVQRLKIGQQNAIAVSIECFKAIAILTR